MPQLLWYLSLPLFPFLWLQGRWARWRTPRLPSLPVPLEGVAGNDGRELRMAVLGESPAAGVGVASCEESLPARLALELANAHHATVVWESFAVNGAGIRDVIDAQLPRVQSWKPDLVVIVLGVNDTTGLTRRAHWRLRVAELVAALAPHPVVFASVPRLDSFTALPQPLRFVLGLRSRLLDADLREATSQNPRVAIAAPLPLLTAEQLAVDRYHPSAMACVIWAQQLAAVAPVP